MKIWVSLQSCTSWHPSLLGDYIIQAKPNLTNLTNLHISLQQMFAALKAIKLAFQTLGCRTVGPPTLRNDDWVGLVPSGSVASIPLVTVFVYCAGNEIQFHHVACPLAPYNDQVTPSYTNLLPASHLDTSS